MRIIPPVAALIYLGTAWGVEKLLPSERLLERSPRTMTVGVALMVAAVTLAVWAVVTFRRHGTTVEPFGTPTQLVTDGPFTWTRNPMYIGVTLLLLGYGVWHGAAVFLAVPAAFLYTANRYYVPREERRLAELFPAEFTAYKASVRRWL